MDAANDPIEYGIWYRFNRSRMLRFARKLGLAEDAVNDAVRRTLEPTSLFPANDASLWWSWHCGVIRSLASTQTRGRARAAKALHDTGAIQAPSMGTQTKHYTRDLGNGPIVYKQPLGHTVHYWPSRPISEVFVCPAGRCKKCGFVLSMRLERETPADDWIEVFGCANGHRQYREVQS